MGLSNSLNEGRQCALVAVVVFMAAVALSGVAAASGVTYLGCDVPAGGDHPASHFDFTINEPNSTVSFFVAEANHTNVETAVFGPDTITWTNDMGLMTLTRTINRVDMSYTEDLNIGGKIDRRVGSCKLRAAKTRKF